MRLCIALATSELMGIERNVGLWGSVGVMMLIMATVMVEQDQVMHASYLNIKLAPGKRLIPGLEIPLLTDRNDYYVKMLVYTLRTMESNTRNTKNGVYGTSVASNLPEIKSMDAAYICTQFVVHKTNSDDW